MMKKTTLFRKMFNSRDSPHRVFLLNASLRSLGEENTVTLWALSQCHGLEAGCLVEINNFFGGGKQRQGKKRWSHLSKRWPEKSHRDVGWGLCGHHWSGKAIN